MTARVQRQTPETFRRRSEGQRTRRPMAPRVCSDDRCGQTYTPRAGGQLRCNDCVAKDRYNWTARKRQPGKRLKGWHHAA
jgi:hypothetical protein